MGSNDKKIFRGYLCFWIVIVLFSLGLFVTSFVIRNRNISTIEEKSISEVIDVASKSGAEFSKLYNQLNKNQQAAYDKLLNDVPKGKLRFEFASLNRAAFRPVFKAFTYDHPEFFWISSYRYAERSNSIVVELVPYDYWKYTSDPDRYIRELNDRINEIVAGAGHLTSTYDKVKYVHDYLVNNIEYDYEAQKEIKNTIRNASTEHALSVYGALVNGKTLCGGYSESFYLLMNAMGVDCYYIQGYASEYHAWNYLKIDGDYYYMDVTWDDKNYKDKNGKRLTPDGISYSYFCITSEELLKDHTPDSDFPAPNANATAYNYFHREGYFFTSYDYKAVSKALLAQNGQQIISIKFGSEAVYLKAKEHLIKGKNIWKIDGFTGTHYSLDDDMYIINVLNAPA